MKRIGASCARSSGHVTARKSKSRLSQAKQGMTKIASMTGIARGTVIGKHIGGQRTDEAEHFFKFELCGDCFDMRDLGAVLDHVGSLGERRLTVAAATKDFHASSCF